MADQMTLDDLDSSKTVTLTFPTDKLLSWFGLPTHEDLQEDMDNADWGTSTKSILEDAGLEYDDGRDVWVDSEGTSVPADAVDEIVMASQDAYRFGTEAGMLSRLHGTLEAMLDVFSNSQYEYRALGDSYFDLSGVAKGILGEQIAWDTTEIQASEDLLHLINDVIAGVGVFEPEYEIGDPAEEIKVLFHHLGDWWEVYGERKPRLDFDNVEDFDQKVWKESLAEIGARYDLELR